MAYDSDLKEVQDILLACAEADMLVLSRPEPVVFLMDFDASSLDFELHFYLCEIDTLLQVMNALQFAILKAPDEADITIPFMQQDMRILGATSSPQNTDGK
ncbi:MAG: hypothetical protein AAGA73_02255 [Pseudomonadota bacterium]